MDSDNEQLSDGSSEFDDENFQLLFDSNMSASKECIAKELDQNVEKSKEIESLMGLILTKKEELTLLEKKLYNLINDSTSQNKKIADLINASLSTKSPKRRNTSSSSKQKKSGHSIENNDSENANDNNDNDNNIEDANTSAMQQIKILNSSFLNDSSSISAPPPTPPTPPLFDQFQEGASDGLNNSVDKSTLPVKTLLIPLDSTNKSAKDPRAKQEKINNFCPELSTLTYENVVDPNKSPIRIPLVNESIANDSLTTETKPPVPAPAPAPQSIPCSFSLLPASIASILFKNITNESKKPALTTPPPPNVNVNNAATSTNEAIITKTEKKNPPPPPLSIFEKLKTVTKESSIKMLRPDLNLKKEKKTFVYSSENKTVARIERLKPGPYDSVEKNNEHGSNSKLVELFRAEAFDMDPVKVMASCSLVVVRRNVKLEKMMKHRNEILVKKWSHFNDEDACSDEVIENLKLLSNYHFCKERNFNKNKKKRRKKLSNQKPSSDDKSGQQKKDALSELVMADLVKEDGELSDKAESNKEIKENGNGTEDLYWDLEENLEIKADNSFDSIYSTSTNEPRAAAVIKTNKNMVKTMTVDSSNETKENKSSSSVNNNNSNNELKDFKHRHNSNTSDKNRSIKRNSRSKSPRTRRSRSKSRSTKRRTRSRSPRPRYRSRSRSKSKSKTTANRPSTNSNNRSALSSSSSNRLDSRHSHHYRPPPASNNNATSKTRDRSNGKHSNDNRKRSSPLRSRSPAAHTKRKRYD